MGTTLVISFTIFFLLILGLESNATTTESPEGDLVEVTVDDEEDANDTSGIVASGNITMDTANSDEAAAANNTAEGVNEPMESPGDDGAEEAMPDSPTSKEADTEPGAKPPSINHVDGSYPPVPKVHYVSTGPLCMSNSECNVTNSERCSRVRAEAKRCECLAGHSRGPDGYTCVASKVYYVELQTEQVISDELKDHSSKAFRKFKYDATNGAIQALQASMLSAILVDVSVSQLSAGWHGKVTVRYDVLLLRSYVPNTVIVTSDVQKAFIDSLDDRSDGSVMLGNTDIPLTVARVKELQVKDANPCVNPLLNYCDVSALCVISARSFTCRCRRGYKDTSPDVIQAPGEHCELECGCKNNGVCELDDKEVPKCSCSQWYLGEECGVDVKLLLIVLAAIFGFLLLMAVVCCACCLKYWRKRHKQIDDASSMYSSPRDRVPMHKLHSAGRNCYDTWRYYSFGPPQYFSTPSGKWPAMMQRSQQCPPLVACRRPIPDSGTPIELVPPGYATYTNIPRPHVLPSSTFPRPQRPDSQWVWSTTGDQESSYA